MKSQALIAPMLRRLLLLACSLSLAGPVATAQPASPGKGRRPLDRKSAAIEAGKTVQMEAPEFQYTHIRNGQRLFRLVARNGQVMKNGDLMLTGVENVELFGQDGRASHVQADFGRWSSEAGDFEIWGNVRGRVPVADSTDEEELSFETYKLVYREAWKTVVTQRPVVLKMGAVTIRGAGLNYNVLNQKLSLHRRVRTSILPDDERWTDPIEIRAGRLDLDPQTRTATYTGSPQMTMGPNRLAGGELTLVLVEGREEIHLTDAVEGLFVEMPAVLEEAEGPDPKAETASENEAPMAEIGSGSGAKLEISAAQADFHLASRSAGFQGEVIASRGEESLRCERLVLLMGDDLKAPDTAIAEGSVELTRPEAVATGGKLLYRFQSGEGVLREALC